MIYKLCIYAVIIDGKKQMVKAETAYCRGSSKPTTDYRKALTIGLAPGGITKAWIMDPCLPPVEVARVESELVKLGPSLGQNDDRYALALKPESKAYIEQYGIPFGSW